MYAASTTHIKPYCGVCYGGKKGPGSLISPCDRSSTHQYHPGCLAQWLRSAMKSGTAHDLQCCHCSQRFELSKVVPMLMAPSDDAKPASTAASLSSQNVSADGAPTPIGTHKLRNKRSTKSAATPKPVLADVSEHGFCTCGDPVAGSNNDQNNLFSTPARVGTKAASAASSSAGHDREPSAAAAASSSSRKRIAKAKAGESKLLSAQELERLNMYLTQKMAKKVFNSRFIECPGGCGYTLLLENPGASSASNAAAAAAGAAAGAGGAADGATPKQKRRKGAAAGNCSSSSSSAATEESSVSACPKCATVVCGRCGEGVRAVPAGGASASASLSAMPSSLASPVASVGKKRGRSAADAPSSASSSSLPATATYSASSSSATVAAIGAHVCYNSQTALNTDDGWKAVQSSAGAGSKPCRWCGNLVVKSHGCNHMTCSCSHQFCYTCGADWEEIKSPGAARGRGCSCPMWDLVQMPHAAAGIPLGFVAPWQGGIILF